MTKLEKHLNETYNCFCFVTHDLELADSIKKIILDFPFWAWIEHEPDDEDGTKHIHFLIKTNGTRKIKHIQDKINLPGNFIQTCKSFVGYQRYFMHLDNPEKHQYKLTDVHTNDHSSFRAAISPLKPDLMEVYNDFNALRSGKMKPQDFVIKNSIQIDKMPFYQKIKTFDIINKNYNSLYAGT